MKRFFSAIILVSSTLLLPTAIVFAQPDLPSVPTTQTPTSTSTTTQQTPWDGNIKIINETGETDIGGVATKIIIWMLAIIALIATVVIIYAGILLIFNGGSEARVAKAKTTLIWAIVGLAVAIGAFAIVNIIQGVLG